MPKEKQKMIRDQLEFTIRDVARRAFRAKYGHALVDGREPLLRFEERVGISIYQSLGIHPDYAVNFEEPAKFRGKTIQQVMQEFGLSDGGDLILASTRHNTGLYTLTPRISRQEIK